MWEVSGNSVERVQEYMDIDSEKPATEAGVPPAYWPASGAIEIKDLTARYSVGGPVVLDKVNVSIPSGKRVGVIGRTGSGKSTLALALLRLIPVEGEVRIDGRDTETVNLDALRRQITIVRRSPFARLLHADRTRLG